MPCPRNLRLDRSCAIAVARQPPVRPAHLYVHDILLIRLAGSRAHPTLAPPTHARLNGGPARRVRMLAVNTLPGEHPRSAVLPSRRQFSQNHNKFGFDKPKLRSQQLNALLMSR
jgi:hypothetical protein